MTRGDREDNKVMIKEEEGGMEEKEGGCEERWKEE